MAQVLKSPFTRLLNQGAGSLHYTPEHDFKQNHSEHWSCENLSHSNTFKDCQVSEAGSEVQDRQPLLLPEMMKRLEEQQRCGSKDGDVQSLD